MSDAWDEIQAIKSKRNSLRERLEKRKKERQDILGNSSCNSINYQSYHLPFHQRKPKKRNLSSTKSLQPLTMVRKIFFHYQL